MKQTTDTWTSMANTSIDKRYVSTSKTFFTRLSSCYKQQIIFTETKAYARKII